MAKKPQEPAVPGYIPEIVLQKAIEQVSNKMHIHGDTEPSFRMIAELWSVYIAHVTEEKCNLKPHDVGYMMNLLKVARAMYGSGDYFENEVDGAGYLALSAMLRKEMPNG